MGTRARIGIVNKDKTITSSYSHWSGDEYLPILKEFYPNEEIVRELLSFGDMSYLAKKIHPTKDKALAVKILQEEKTHSYENPEKDVCVFYNRDRGEDEVNSVISKDLNEFLELCGDSCAEYYYLFKNNKWTRKEF